MKHHIYVYTIKDNMAQFILNVYNVLFVFPVKLKSSTIMLSFTSTYKKNH